MLPGVLREKTGWTWEVEIAGHGSLQKRRI
jgi:hypothetical protein